jgi:hypothetical protein
MSLTTWERQRDLLVLQKLGMEKDMAEMYRLGDDCNMAERPDLSQRIDRLITVLKSKIATQEALIDYAESRIEK